MTALVVAGFARAAPYGRAIVALRQQERRIVGLWSPCATDAEEGNPVGARWIVPAMIAAGICSAALLYALVWWSAAVAYPFNSGGRPLNSWPTFLIAPIEFGALVAGIAGVATFLVRAHLTRLHDSAFDIDEVDAATRDSFVIAVSCDAGEDANTLLALLAEAGAVHSRLIER